MGQECAQQRTELQHHRYVIVAKLSQLNESYINRYIQWTTSSKTSSSSHPTTTSSPKPSTPAPKPSTAAASPRSLSVVASSRTRVLFPTPRPVAWPVSRLSTGARGRVREGGARSRRRVQRVGLEGRRRNRVRRLRLWRRRRRPGRDR